MRYLALFIIFSVNQLVYAQEKFLFSKEANPIVYANIYSKDFGTVSNEEGVFEISRFHDRDSIMISHIGYHRLTISKKQLFLLDTVYLEPNHIVLNEVVIGGFSARDTLSKAISRISNNYFVDPYNSLGLYRQHLVEDEIGVEMAETYVLSYHPKYKKNQSGQAKILSGKSTKNYSEFRLQTVGGVIPIINGADVVKNQQGILNPDVIENYQFSFEGIIDDDFYVISFKAKQEADIDTNRYGKLYIEKNSLAIIQVEINSDKEKLSRINEGLEIIRADIPEFFTADIQTIVKYRKAKNGKYVLSFVYAVNELLGIYKGNTKNYKSNVKYIMTDIKTKDVEKIKSNYDAEVPFILQDKNMSSNEFWFENNSEFIFSNKERNILRDIENQNQ